MTLEELQAIFPSLKQMSLEKNYLVLNMVNEFGIDKVAKELFRVRDEKESGHDDYCKKNSTERAE